MADGITPKRTVHLVGMAHHNRFIHGTMELLKRKVKPGMVIGLELDAKRFKTVMKYVENRRRPLFNTRDAFWFNIINFLNKKNVTIVPIDSGREPKSFRDRFSRKRAVARIKKAISRRDENMVQAINNKHVDLAIVGFSHAPSIYKNLRNIGLTVKPAQVKDPSRIKMKGAIRKLYNIPTPKRRLKSGGLRRI